MFKTLLINLNKDKDRLDFMSRQLKSLSISFERVEAVYGKEYRGSEYDKDLALKLNGKELSVGEVGCSLSHKRSIEKFLESQSDYCLILEDDVKLDKDFKNILEKEIKNNEEYYLKYKKCNWEYLQFDYWDPNVFWFSRWRVQVFATFKNQKTFFSKFIFALKTLLKLPIVFCFAFFEIIRSEIVFGPVKFYRDIYLAGAYLINRSGAAKLLSLSEKIVYTADRLQNEAKKQKSLKIKYYSPVVVFQNREDYKTNIF